MIKNKHSLIIFLSVSLMVLCVKGYAEDFGLITGPNHIYALIIPEGWRMDSEYRKRSGFPAPYFIVPSSAENTQTHIYSMGSEVGLQPLEEFIFLSQKRLQDAVGKLTIEKKKIVNTKDNSSAYIYHYTGYWDNRIEDVAFIKKKSLIAVVAFSTHDRDKYNKYYTDFLKVVQSFFFIGDDPQNLKIKNNLK